MTHDDSHRANQEAADTPGPHFLEALGDALRLLRRRRRLRQWETAELASITKAMLSAYETGRNVPALTTLVAILVGLKTNFRELQDALDAVMVINPRENEQAPDDDNPSEMVQEGDFAAATPASDGDIIAQLRRIGDALEKLTLQDSSSRRRSRKEGV